jgi:hypothetical protein
VTPCARGSRSRERRPGITWGCPNLGCHYPTPITCHFCAMQRDLMCDATYVTLEHTRFRPQCGVRRGAARGKKPAFRVKSASSGRFWGRFRAISATPCQHPGTSVTWRTWRRPHGQRAHFREYTASVHIRSRAPGRTVAPGDSIEPALCPACSRSVRESGTDRRRFGLPFASGSAPGRAQG